MSTLLFTLITAFIVCMIAIGLLALGWLITGQSKIRPGACGRDPTKKKDEKCSDDEGSCGLCKKEDNSP